VPKLIKCECGYVARADGDDGVIEAIRAPQLGDPPAAPRRVGAAAAVLGPLPVTSPGSPASRRRRATASVMAATIAAICA
jgi:hypothetical protein